jgi:hypothetical protein
MVAGYLDKNYDPVHCPTFLPILSAFSSLSPPANTCLLFLYDKEGMSFQMNCLPIAHKAQIMVVEAKKCLMSHTSLDLCVKFVCSEQRHTMLISVPKLVPLTVHVPLFALFL